MDAMSSGSGGAAPDLSVGLPFDSLPDGGMVAGRVGGENVLLVRRGGDVFAIGASCTHYGGPLEDGLLVGDTVRCPWHHASFCLRTGAVRRAPALDPLPCWRVERLGETVFVRERLAPPRPPRPPSNAPERVVIVGGGAAGHSAAETLRREGYLGRITLLSADETPPCDRPNLSKGFLSGGADDSSNLLRSAAYYRRHGIDLELGARVASLDTSAREARLADGTARSWDSFLLATGAEPVRLDLPGAGLPHAHYLRTLTDARALVARASAARRAVVIGASFIGLEAAASLRARGIAVDVVAPDSIPMERVLGRDVGTHLRRLHEAHGVAFHLETKASVIGDDSVTLANGRTLVADLVVVGIGVRPILGLAEQAGLAVDRGVLVDSWMRTSAPGVFAAGDIARWPDALSGDLIRVEHWVVAQRQGQTAARNMLGRRERFDCVPFFWTEQYDFSLAYVGHAESWDEVEIDGRLDEGDCTITYWRGGRKLAVAAIHRDRAGLRAELEFEKAMIRALGAGAGSDLPDRERAVCLG
jgi:NADPH-dependent 2,4-dienoyl-CoA reductase/sulfur reductase-like enzyme/nitrite reductase/ring-hydroxylating ferredoxin subunit